MNSQEKFAFGLFLLAVFCLANAVNPRPTATVSPLDSNRRASCPQCTLQLCPLFLDGK
jgi:hypothetical protein